VPLQLDVSLFAEPWEQVRLLSDGHRNSALLAMLRRRAPGARVLEIGAGTGIWVCAAARLGAEHVVAVEPSGMAELVRELVDRNGLQDRVTVLDALIEDLPPEPMDLVFSELLNADPFAEGVLESSAVARDWLPPGGHLAPNRLQIFAQLAHVEASAEESTAARAQIDGVAASLGLDLAPLVGLATRPGVDRQLGQDATLLGPPGLLWDLDLTVEHATPEDPIEAWLPVRVGALPPTGAVVWFRAWLDDGIALTNTPGTDNHWGQLICGWVEPGATDPRGVRVRAWLGDDGVVVEAAD